MRHKVCGVRFWTFSLTMLSAAVLLPGQASDEPLSQNIDKTIALLENSVPFFNQNDPTFAPFLLPDGRTNLCGPAVLAHRILAARRTSADGFASVRVWTSIGPYDDPHNYIRYLASLCRTGKRRGTLEEDFLNCLEAAMTASGAATTGTRAASLAARSSLTRSTLEKTNFRTHAVFLLVKPFRIFPPSIEPTFDMGHFLVAYGIESQWDSDTFNLVVFEPSPMEPVDPKAFRDARFTTFITPPWMKLDRQPLYVFNQPFTEGLGVALDDVIVMPLRISLP